MKRRITLPPDRHTPLPVKLRNVQQSIRDVRAIRLDASWLGMRNAYEKRMQALRTAESKLKTKLGIT